MANQRQENSKPDHSKTWTWTINKWAVEPSMAAYGLWKNYSPSGLLRFAGGVGSKFAQQYGYDNVAYSIDTSMQVAALYTDPITTSVSYVANKAVGYVADQSIEAYWNTLTEEQKNDPANAELAAFVKVLQIHTTSHVASKVGEKVKSTEMGKNVTQKVERFKKALSTPSTEQTASSGNNNTDDGDLDNAQTVSDNVNEAAANTQQQLDQAQASADNLNQQRSEAIAGIQRMLDDGYKPSDSSLATAEKIYQQAAEYGHDVSLKKSGSSHNPRFVSGKGNNGSITMGKRGGKPSSYAAPTATDITNANDHVAGLEGQLSDLQNTATSADKLAKELVNKAAGQEGDTTETAPNQPKGPAYKRPPSSYSNKQAEEQQSREPLLPILLDNDQLEHLLNNQLANIANLRVLTPIDGVTQHNGYNQFKEQLQQYLNAYNGESHIVMPINLGASPEVNQRYENSFNQGLRMNNAEVGEHWVLVYLQFDAQSPQPIRVVYVDSINPAINADILTSLQQVLGNNINVENLSHQKQQNRFTCGDWVITAARTLVNGQLTPKDDADITQGSINDERRAHISELARAALLRPNRNHAQQRDASVTAAEVEAQTRAQQTEEENQRLLEQLTAEKAEREKLQKENGELKATVQKDKTTELKRRRPVSQQPHGNNYNPGFFHAGNDSSQSKQEEEAASNVPSFT